VGPEKNSVAKPAMQLRDAPELFYSTPAQKQHPIESCVRASHVTNDRWAPLQRSRECFEKPLHRYVFLLGSEGEGELDRGCERWKVFVDHLSREILNTLLDIIAENFPNLIPFHIDRLLGFESANETIEICNVLSDQCAHFTDFPSAAYLDMCCRVKGFRYFTCDVLSPWRPVAAHELHVGKNIFNQGKPINNAL
jgi:hypothetical protein